MSSRTMKTEWLGEENEGKTTDNAEPLMMQLVPAIPQHYLYLYFWVSLLGDTKVSRRI